MKTCDTCKHYTPSTRWTVAGSTQAARDAKLGQCCRWRGGEGSGGYDWSPEDIGENGVVVETDEGWGAYMGPKFGCVLHESN